MICKVVKNESMLGNKNKVSNLKNTWNCGSFLIFPEKEKNILKKKEGKKKKKRKNIEQKEKIKSELIKDAVFPSESR